MANKGSRKGTKSYVGSDEVGAWLDGIAAFTGTFIIIVSIAYLWLNWAEIEIFFQALVDVITIVYNFTR